MRILPSIYAFNDDTFFMHVIYARFIMFHLHNSSPLPPFPPAFVSIHVGYMWATDPHIQTLKNFYISLIQQLPDVYQHVIAFLAPKFKQYSSSERSLITSPSIILPQIRNVFFFMKISKRNLFVLFHFIDDQKDKLKSNGNILFI